ncbi:hypothetical protein JD844_025460 [Phrynosoma platyrhinos]|uniref:Uncharacterized protein n=1 Tax=Phrynosoma platyrhinos TaxID=52577 RepID=A0ABQ7SZW2_PHRPL|nr:hypothetical protein JD844_025460 [Phrynosoma platyrhinos]
MPQCELIVDIFCVAFETAWWEEAAFVPVFAVKRPDEQRDVKYGLQGEEQICWSAFYSVKVAGKKSSLEQLADAMEMIQKSSNDMELQMAGLKFIAKLLEEEPGREWQEKQVLKSESELTIRSVVFLKFTYRAVVTMWTEKLSKLIKELGNSQTTQEMSEDNIKGDNSN